MNPQQGFLRKNNRAFGNGLRVAGETQRLEVIHEVRFEQRLAVVAAERGEKARVVIRDMELAEESDRRRQTRRQGEPAAKRRLAEEQLEDGLAIRPAGLPITASHGQLVKAGEQRPARHRRRRSQVMLS